MLTDVRRSGSRLVLTLLCLAQFMLIVDVVIVNVAIPSIRADLQIADSRLQLVAVAYTVTFGSLLIVFGRVGDLYGRRRLFVTGLLVFTAASLTTGLADSEWHLVVSRAVQGLGAAMVSPTALSILTASFPEGHERNRALGYWGAVGSAGAVAGQLLGGVLTEAFGWRSIFLINVPLGIVAAAITMSRLAETRVRTRSALDVRGAFLLAGGLAAAILALTQVGEGHIDVALGLAVVAAAVLAAFVRTERRHPLPLVDGSLLRTGHVLTANALLAVNAGMLGGSLFFTTLYLQVVLAYSPLAVGAAFAPLTLAILLLSPRIGGLVSTAGVRRLLTVGFSLASVGMLTLARLPRSGDYLTDVLPALAMLAVGSAFAYAPTFVAGTGQVPEDKQGVASGLLNASQELGAAVGITALATIAASVTTGTAAEALLAGYRVALVVAAAVMAGAIVLVRRLPSR